MKRGPTKEVQKRPLFPNGSKDTAHDSGAPLCGLFCPCTGHQSRPGQGAGWSGGPWRRGRGWADTFWSPQKQTDSCPQASRAGASDVPVQGFVALTTRCDHFQPMILFIAPPCVDSGGGGHLHQDRGASLPARPLTTPKGDSCQDHVHQRGCAFCRVFCAI